MRAQRTVLETTRPGLPFVKRRLRHRRRVAMHVAVLLVFGLAVPGAAHALQFDSFSLSAFVESTAISGGRPSATFTATAQDFSLQIGFHDQSDFTSLQTVRLGCFGSDIRACRRPNDTSTGSTAAPTLAT